MTEFLCRNRVEDYTKWRTVFDSHAEAHREAGFKLLRVWRALDDPQNVFFLFEVESVEKAQEFIDDPAAAEGAAQAGVIDGEYFFLQSEELY